MIDLENLKRLAKAATPGPWRVDKELSIVAPKAPVMVQGSVRIVIDEIPIHMDDETRDYIAAASPDVVLALIERVEELEQKLEERQLDVDCLRAAIDKNEPEWRCTETRYLSNEE